MGRLIGAVFRAALVMLVIVAPAFLAPDAGRNAQEISLIIGALAAAFVFVEYGSTHPGLTEFRFAPPYNRARFATFAAVLLVITFYTRAQQGMDGFSDSLRTFAAHAAQYTDFPLSPVRIARNTIGDGGSTEFSQLVSQAAAVSFVTAAAFTAFFIVLLTLFGWPTRRATFNLWLNMPTFEPSTGRDVERRLRRTGKLTMLAGFALPFYLLIFASRSSGWFNPEVLKQSLSLIWACVLWAAVPALLILRGAALLKIARLIERARGGAPA